MFGAASGTDGEARNTLEISTINDQRRGESTQGLTVPRLHLDWSRGIGRSSASDGFDRVSCGNEIEIHDEVGLLDCLRCFPHMSCSSDTTQIFRICGAQLCRWADEWAQGRGIDTVRVLSPLDVLRRMCPGLKDEAADYLYAALADWQTENTGATAIIDILARANGTNANLPDILYALWPVRLWRAVPSLAHAAEWLLWLSEQHEDDPLLALASEQARLWREVAGDASIAYDARLPGEAVLLLEMWLFGEIPAPVDGTNQSTTSLANRASLSPLIRTVFPASVPVAWCERARVLWERSLPSSSGGALWNRLASVRLAPELRKIAAKIVAKYALHYPAILTPALVVSLSLHLPDEEIAALQQICPPLAPALLTTDMPPLSVMNWFQREYLPYRIWQVQYGDSHVAERVIAAAHSFARWCLAFYPPAIAGGRGSEFLAIQDGKRLRGPATINQVTLWIILDGLTLPDAEFLLRELQGMEPRLSQDILRPVVSSLPTITSFTKNALMNGSPPGTYSLAGERAPAPSPAFARARRLLDRDSDVEIAQQAQHGDILVLSLLEPDFTYHSRRGSVATGSLRHQVNGVLLAAAAKIGDIVRAIPDDKTLRVILSTDHGRLLDSSGTRNCPVPAGMDSELRAAWRSPASAAEGIEYGADGVCFVSGDESNTEASADRGIVYLSAQRFELPTDCAIVLGPSSFYQNDGRGGPTPFAHGGLWPEEVLTPWAELRRDAAVHTTRPPVKCLISGQGRVGSHLETVEMVFENGSQIPLFVASVSLVTASGQSLMLGLPEQGILIPPFATGEGKATVPVWPSSAELLSLTVQVEIALPNGERFPIPEGEIECELTTSALYEQTLSARDLMDF